MTDSPLIIKSKEFALQIIKVCNYIKQTKKESVLTNQLIRSGTSVGANIREAFYGHGTADFVAKLQIALKECSESEYWLELLIESGYYDDNEAIEVCSIYSDCIKALDSGWYNKEVKEFMPLLRKVSPSLSRGFLFDQSVYKLEDMRKLDNERNQ